MRQTNSQVEARKAFLEHYPLKGPLKWFARFTRLQLAITSAALVCSVVLLFVSTIVYHFQSGSTFDSLVRFLAIDLHTFPDLFGHSATTPGLIPMYVACVSILVEIGLIFAVLLQDFKASLFWSTLMGFALLQQLRTPSSALEIPSMAFQVLFFASFMCFTMGLKVKVIVTDRMMLREKESCEMRSSPLIL